MFVSSSVRTLSRRLEGLDLQLGRMGEGEGEGEGEQESGRGRGKADGSGSGRGDELIGRIRNLGERLARIDADNFDQLKIQSTLSEEVVLPLSILQKEVEHEDGAFKVAMSQGGMLHEAAGNLEEVRKRMAILDNFKVSAAEMQATKIKLDELEKCLVELAKDGESQTERARQLMDVYKQFVTAMSKKSLEWDAKLSAAGF